MRGILASLKFSALLLAIAIVPFAAHCDSGALKTRKDWDELFKSCESNWPKYDSDLNRLRTVLKREIDQMSESDYMKRFQNDDLMIRFMRVHWPAIFASKDPGWNFYQACSELNWEVRKSLNDFSATRTERSAKINKFKDCLLGVWAPRGPVPQPFVRLLACYNKQNK